MNEPLVLTGPTGLTATLYCGDCLEVLPTLPDNSVDAVVTDPPYGLSFMGKDWDHGVPGVAFWREVLRVAKPGTHLLAFGGTRTHHRLMCAIEDAGWKIRDCLGWLYGSGFPKSHNLDGDWQGWGTALKPAWEPIVLARKPLEGTVAGNVLQYGTGAINVDGCRVSCDDKAKFPAGVVSDTEAVFGGGSGLYADRPRPTDSVPNGRWPANILHDGSEEVLGVMPQTTSGIINPRIVTRPTHPGSSFPSGARSTSSTFGGDSGSAARFFYCAKAGKADRDEGREDNNHPTVKPTALMRYLCRLITPPGGTVLDPFMGSGSTGKAALLEGFNFAGMEIEAGSFGIAAHRIRAAKAQGVLL